MRIAATLTTAGLLLAVGSSAPQVAGAAEPQVDSCVQPASTGGCDGELGLGRVLPHREAPKPCILPAVYRGGPLEPCASGQQSTPLDPTIVPLRRSGRSGLDDGPSTAAAWPATAMLRLLALAARPPGAAVYSFSEE